MDSNYQNPEGKGSAFLNTYKEEGSKAPDFKGTVRWQGEELKIAVWKNKTKKGDPYCGIQLEKQNEQDLQKSNEPKRVEAKGW